MSAALMADLADRGTGARPSRRDRNSAGAAYRGACFSSDRPPWYVFSCRRVHGPCANRAGGLNSTRLLAFHLQLTLPPVGPRGGAVASLHRAVASQVGVPKTRPA